jgi:TRAP transporter TAXI family solute receptor
MTACEQGPPPDSIQRDLESVINLIVPADLLTLQSVTVIEMRRGDTGPGSRAVRFVAQAKLNRAINFSAWDQFSVAAMANAFGTRPEKIEGIAPRGNNAGDVLTIPGTAIYEQDSKLSPPWRLRALRPMGTPPPPATDVSYFRQLLALAGTTASTWKIVFHNLSWPPVRALALVAREKGGFAIASGPPGSDGWRIVDALRHADLPHPVVNVARQTVLGEIRMLREGIVAAAIIDNDTADMAAKGEGPFALTGAYKDLRAVASLYPRPVHVVLNAASQVSSLADLRNKPIVLVGDGMGTSKIADDVLRAYRLTNNIPEPIIVPSLTDALDSLAAGKVDAVIAVGAAPQSDIAVAVAAHDFRLLSLDGDAIALLTSGDTHYLAATIPGRTYRGQQNAVATVATAMMLVADTNVPATEIKLLLQSVFSPVPYLKLGSTAGMLIRPATALVGLPVPLHQGATAIYQTPTP